MGWDGLEGLGTSLPDRFGVLLRLLTGGGGRAQDSYFAAPERGPRAEGDEFAEYVVRVVSPFLPEPKPAWYTPTLSAAATRVIAALRNTAPPTTPTYQERLLALKNKFPVSRGPRVCFLR